jgi:hypothetical protein
MIKKKELEAAADSLLKQGMVEIVGERNCEPVYASTQPGRRAEAPRTGTPVDEIGSDGGAPELPPAPKPESAALRALRTKAAELWPSLRKGAVTRKNRDHAD